MFQVVSTEFIVLKKSIFQNSSLIVSGISPDKGRISLILKGARKISKSSFSEVDYFRIFSISFYDSEKTLITPITFELLRTHDTLASIPEKLTEAFGIVPFIMKNKYYGISCNILYKTLLRYFDSLVQDKQYQRFFIKLAYLYESGLLPEKLAHSDKDQETNERFLSLLIDCLLDAKELPTTSEDYYIKFEKWIDHLCLVNEL